jgi:hypothetical protein
VSGHATKQVGSNERLVLGEGAKPLVVLGAVAAVVGIVAAIALGYSKASGFEPFLYAYLAAYAFCFSIVLGATFFVLIQHLTRAGWSVGVRRVAEHVMGLMPWMALLAIPMVLSVMIQKGELYPWAQPLSAASPQAIAAAQKGEAEEPAETPSAHEAEAGGHRALDAVTLQKRGWLNPWFFTARMIVYYAILLGIASFYKNQSLRQDTTADPNITRKLQACAGFCVVIFGLTLTGLAGDLFMSLDPHWYSTMWGVYYFAGCTLGNFSTLILVVWLLQRAGYLRNTINVEHYHDLGKYLFGFTFFWGYIAFSQYMLLWYANIPEEIEWFNRHGATTVAANITGWSYVILALLFGQLLIPFAGLLSRYAKRRPNLLAFWALWVLSFHLLDSIWIVMPEYPGTFSVSMIVLTIAAVVGMAGLLTMLFVRGLLGQNLRPAADPRLGESLAFQNI